jgi:hypothetical protein
MITTISKRISYLSSVFVASVLLPLVSFAQAQPIPPAQVATGCSRKMSDLKGLLNFPVCIINRYVIPLLITVALALFIFGIVRYIANADDPAEHKKMKDFVLWSLFAIFIILSVWAIIYFFANSIPLGK